ncbi:MAG: ABC transporter permease [Calditrichaeota bacterium]|nr:MAG: ABC transporter permease [Calditrichota bacterium]
MIIFLKRLFTNKLASVGFLIILALVLTSIFASIFSPHNPLLQNLDNAYASPSATHWLGQDSLGRDIFSRIIYGSRISLKVGVFSVGIASLFGVFLGAISGYYGGWIDEILMRITDVMLAFPGILLAIAIVAILGTGIDNVIIALTIVGWKSYARLTRGQFLAEKEKDYVQASKALGFSDFRIIFIHILPNTLAPVLVAVTLGMAGMITAEAGLSFLGLGAEVGEPSWGAMLTEGRRYILLYPQLTLFPGIAIMITVLGFNLLGDGLQEILDPKKRK